MSLQVRDFLELNEWLTKGKHCFRSEKSVVTSGINYIESIIGSRDGNEQVLSVFIDLTRLLTAFHQK